MNWISKNKIKKIIKFYLFLFIFAYFLGFLVNSFVSNNFVFNLNFELFFSFKTLLFAVEIVACIIVVRLCGIYKYYWSQNSKKLLKGKDEDKFVLSNLESAHFQSSEELNKNFNQLEFSKLKSTSFDGIPIKAEFTKNKQELYFAQPAHTLIIGTTGSGKTSTFISPTIQLLARTKTKPSMLISDPKGELFALHSGLLKKQGYEIKVLDLRNPYNSIKWNPLEQPFLKYQRMLNLEKEITFCEDKQCYFFDGKEFCNKREVDVALQVQKQKLFDEVYEDVHDIVSIICPITNKSEPIWESGAQNFVFAIALAMLEDSENHAYEMTKEKFNFYNIMKVATNTDNNCEHLKEYFSNRPKLSSAVSLSKQVLDASEKTRNSYLSIVFDKLLLFNDKSICSLTSADELNFGELATKPMALFLQIPDEKETRHSLASMAVLQAYKALVAKANTYSSLTLPNNVYFLLDEFGNLPKIYKLEQMITVGRSRKIWLCLVVQSYAQLSKVYDERSADIIKSNCNIQIFIGTSDLKTIEEFSKLCGNFSIIQRGVSFNTDKEDMNSSVSIRERPLIYPSELAELNSNKNLGNAIVRVFGYPPIKSRFTPSFQCELYDLSLTKNEVNVENFFDENAVFYDVLKHNQICCEQLGVSVKKDNSIDQLKNEIFALSEEICSDNEKLNMIEFLKQNKVTKVKKMLRQLTERAEILQDDFLKEQVHQLEEKINY